MKKQVEQESPETPKRDLEKEIQAFNVCTETLRPLEKDARARIWHATAKFLDIHIPRDEWI